ncbi:Pex2/Pex12 amino terminal region, partial [Colletotrichum chrysophilum]
MSSSPEQPQHPTLPSSPYPYASAPDIIRAHQKDAYYKGHLSNTLTSLHRLLLGARSAHSATSLHGLLADTLYLALTTLPGNRTLGEEYCDLVQLHVPPSNP